jgi:xanthine dehydrogenase accessory factor
MSAWIGTLSHLLAAGRRAVLVTVAHTSGSAPRDAGTSMVVTDDAIEGTIGGGHLEFEAIRIARDALAHEATPATTWIVRFPLAARLGQCCGGVSTLAFTAVDGAARAWLDRAAACVRTSTPFALVAHAGGARVTPTRLLVTADDAHGSLGDAVLDSDAIALARPRLAAGAPGAGLSSLPGKDAATLLVHVVRPDAFRVLIFGNGHVGRALVRVMGVLLAQVRWIDARAADFPAAVPDNVETVATDTPEDEIANAPPGAYVVVMTHSHALDFDLVEAALARDDWRYLGLIGSRAKRAQFERRLAARGATAEVLARVVCPIGASGGNAIRSKEPGAIAVAVAAELLAARDAAAAGTPPPFRDARAMPHNTRGMPVQSPWAIAPPPRNGNRT